MDKALSLFSLIDPVILQPKTLHLDAKYTGVQVVIDAEYYSYSCRFISSVTCMQTMKSLLSFCNSNLLASLHLCTRFSSVPEILLHPLIACAQFLIFCVLNTMRYATYLVIMNCGLWDEIKLITNTHLWANSLTCSVPPPLAAYTHLHLLSHLTPCVLFVLCHFTVGIMRPGTESQISLTRTSRKPKK